MVIGLSMDRHDISACGDKIFRIFCRVFDHKVNVERFSCDLLHRFNDHRADSNVGNKMAIHDIDMYQVRTGSFYVLYLFL